MTLTYEAVYEDGVVRLAENVRLPEHTKVYVVVPGAGEKADYRVGSPRLANPQQAADFVKEVVDEDFDASIR